MNMKQFKEFLDEEQLDELSSDTLKKYKTAAHKAIGDAAVKQHAGKMGSKEYHAHQDKRSKGINRADADKRLGTYKDKTPKHLDISANAKSIQKDGDRYRYNEENDICNVCGQTPCNCTHVDVSEEVEQIDELEKKTVHSYLNKADPSQGMRNAEKETPGILKNPNALRQYKKKVKAGVSRALDRLKPKQSVSEAAQIGVGSKVYHPIHGSGKVLKHSTGAGADHWAEVKFLSGNTKRVNRKHLKLEEVEHIEELSNELLDRYKKKAGEAASAADKAKDFEKGHKRFKGIVKATFKQFANDDKK